MKKLLVLLALMLALPTANLSAQSIVLGQKVPEIKLDGWLGDKIPTPANLTYVEFFNSANPACKTSMIKLRETTNKLGTKLRVVVITQEKEEKIEPILTEFLSPRIFVGLDPQGDVAEAFGVQYVPFGVLLDSKNRVIWMGNSLQLTPHLIAKVTK